MASRSAPLGAAAIGMVLACGPGAAEARAHRRHAPPPPSALERKVEGLSQTVNALDARLTQEAAARQAMEAQLQAAKADAAASRADAQAARAELDAQIKTIPGDVSTAVQAENAHGLPFQGIRITPGGFLAAEAIYRSKNEASDISSSFSRIPFPNSPLAHTNELRFTARQTRLSLLVQGDVNSQTHAAFYGEFDFQAAAQTANSLESNSFNPRIRHLYGTLDWDGAGLHLLVGQNWSLVTLNTKGITPRNELPPPSIDGQYIPGFAWARQPQIRLTKDWNSAVWVAVSAENPQTSFAGVATGISSTASGVTVLSVTPGIAGFDTNNSLSLNHIPDVVGKVAFEPSIGGKRPLHLEAFGLWRSYDVRVSVAPVNALGLPPGNFNAHAHGGGVGGSALFTAIPGHLDLQASVLSGRGIGRYGTSQLPDVTLRPDGTVAPIHEIMFLVGGTWHVTPALDLYVLGGEEREKSRYFNDPTGHYGFGNPAATFTAATCTTEGGVCVPNLRKVQQITVGAWQKAFTGSFGQIRVGVQYSHTKLTGFSGLGGYAPKTAEDMVFTSFRYYLPTPN
ncbi:MAG: hypothetical protein JWQ97_2798 [Phenylobacterium sp.]|nr:hypothetical protein [Phenylobacterium sp.]